MPISTQKVQLNSIFSISNKNPVGLKGVVDYDLFVNGKQFSSGVSSSIEVGANDESSFSIQSEVDLVQAFGVIADLLSAVQSGKRSIPFEIKGSFRSDVFGVKVEAPVDASGEIPLPKSPRIEIKF